MRFRPIPENPVIRFSCHRVRDARPFPFSDSRARYFGYGRTALAVGLELLGFYPGENVLVPEFICIEALRPFIVRGLKLRFYRVDGLAADLEHAGKLVDRQTRALLVVHYFGLPQDVAAIRKFCRHHAVTFIEDNAHGLMSEISEGPLGSFGDIGIFSFRKTLSVPDGAALLAPGHVQAGVALKHDYWVDVFRRGATFAGRNLARLTEATIGAPVMVRAKWARSGAPPNERGGSAAVTADVTDARTWSSLSRAIVARTDWGVERDTRVAAYRFWSGFLSDGAFAGQPLGPADLPPGVIPQAFPMLCRNSWTVIDALRHAGVEAYVWPGWRPSLPGQSNQAAVCIPLHQVPVRRDS